MSKSGFTVDECGWVKHFTCQSGGLVFQSEHMLVRSLRPHLWDGDGVGAREVLLKSYRVGRGPSVSRHFHRNDPVGEESIRLPSHVLHHHKEFVTAAHLRVQSRGSWQSQWSTWYNVSLYLCVNVACRVSIKDYLSGETIKTLMSLLTIYVRRIKCSI